MLFWKTKFLQIGRQFLTPRSNLYQAGLATFKKEWISCELGLLRGIHVLTGFLECFSLMDSWRECCKLTLASTNYRSTNWNSSLRLKTKLILIKWFATHQTVSMCTGYSLKMQNGAVKESVWWRRTLANYLASCLSFTLDLLLLGKRHPWVRFLILTQRNSMSSTPVLFIRRQLGPEFCRPQARALTIFFRSSCLVPRSIRTTHPKILRGTTEVEQALLGI